MQTPRHCSYKQLSQMSWESSSKVYNHNGPESPDHAAQQAGRVESSEIQDLKRRILEEKGEAADLASDIADYGARETAKAADSMAGKAEELWDAWSDLVTIDAVTDAGADVIVGAQKGSREAQRYVSEKKAELVEARDEALADLKQLEAELQRKVAQLDKAVHEGFGDAVEAGLVTLDQAVNTAKLSAQEYAQIAEKAIQENIVLPAEYWMQVGKRAASYRIDQSVRFLVAAQEQGVDLAVTLVDMASQGKKGIEIALQYAKETATKLPQQVMVKIEQFVRQNTPEEALQVIEDVAHLGQSVERLVVVMAEKGADSLVRGFEFCVENGIRVPARLIELAAQQAAEWTVEQAVQVLNACKEAAVDAGTIVLALAGGGAVMVLAVAAWAVETGYTIPKEYWVKVAEQVGSWSVEQATVLLDTMLGIGADLGLVLEAMVKGGADMALAGLEWCVEHGYEIPKAIWPMLVEQMADWTSQQINTLLDALAREDTALAETIVHLAGAGADKAILAAQWCVEHGYDIPKEYWVKVAEQVGEWTSEQLTVLLDTMLGIGADILMVLGGVLAGGAALTLTALAWCKENAYDVPKEYWTKVAEQVGEWTTEQATVLLDTMLGMGADLAIVLEAMADAGADMALAGLEWCVEHGYEIPKAFLVKLAHSMGSWAQEQIVRAVQLLATTKAGIKAFGDAVAAVGGAVVIGVVTAMVSMGMRVTGRLQRAYNAAVKQQSEWEQKGRTIRTGDADSTQDIDQ